MKDKSISVRFYLSADLIIATVIWASNLLLIIFEIDVLFELDINPFCTKLWTLEAIFVAFIVAFIAHEPWRLDMMFVKTKLCMELDQSDF